MTARNYDVTLGIGSINALTTVGAFTAGNVIIGNTSSASGIIANVNLSANTLKVKLNNSVVKFITGEYFHSNVSTHRILNVDFTVTDLASNSTSVTVNNLNYAELNQNLSAAMTALRTDGNTITESIANALILPIPANTK